MPRTNSRYWPRRAFKPTQIYMMLTFSHPQISARSSAQLRKTLATVALTAATTLFTGCGVSGTPTPDAGSTAIGTSATVSDNETVRQTDAQGHSLPFTTTFPRRWNSGNDGTSYEPCTSATTDILRDAGLDPLSVRDAATVDFQTARGCKWKYSGRRLASLSQTVGNSSDLATYKSKQSTAVTWNDDIRINGRLVAVSTEPDGRICDTYVESGTAVVVTSTYFNHGRPPINEICDKAIAFTRATIDQMPE
ncbi:DUF3558 domain-containing protein [Gordonia sputi]|uniref:DUF3558 domain-containing protein n=1 Tax=Gordonia sputi TaxID=36823 RepID=UPI0036A9C88D